MVEGKIGDFKIIRYNDNGIKISIQDTDFVMSAEEAENLRGFLDISRKQNEGIGMWIGD